MQQVLETTVARYLLVDDSPTIRLTLAAAIKQATRTLPEILEASDATQALQQFKKGPVDAVFLDMVLDETQESGLHLMDKLLAIDPKTRVILVTGLPSSDPVVVKGIRQGAFAFLPKPARTDAIRKILNEMETESGRFGRIR